MQLSNFTKTKVSFWSLPKNFRLFFFLQKLQQSKRKFNSMKIFKYHPFWIDDISLNERKRRTISLEWTLIYFWLTTRPSSFIDPFFSHPDLYTWHYLTGNPSYNSFYHESTHKTRIYVSLSAKLMCFQYKTCLGVSGSCWTSELCVTIHFRVEPLYLFGCSCKSIYQVSLLLLQNLLFS